MLTNKNENSWSGTGESPPDPVVTDVREEPSSQSINHYLADRPFHPIDVFFHSLALDSGHYVIGVVLSGMEADGAAGLKALKSEGEIAIVQSTESARTPTCRGAVFLRIT